MARKALVAGVSGIVGNNLARHLLAQGWEVSGLARRPPAGRAGPGRLPGTGNML